MRFGPTSLKASSTLAKGLRRPKFRTDLRISEQVLAGAVSYVIKIPETSSYSRYGASEHELLTMCDGTRTRVEVAALWNERHPDEPLAENEVLEFLGGIEPEMWEQSAGEKNLAVLERIRDERKSRVDQSSMLYISFKAWDPNATLAKMDPYLGWMFTPAFVWFSVGLFAVAMYLVAGDWTRVQSDTASLYSFADKTAYDIWVFWFLLLFLGAVHEFGHGLTCKHFGGDVHQMGFLLIYFTPAFYTDTTDIILFDRLASRQWVLFAGIWIELVICGIAALVWRFTAPASFVNDLAYKTMLLSGIQGAVLNLNPLIKADGYYALSEYLRMDNLREESFEFLKACGRKYILREDMDLPAAARRERYIYLVFGSLAILYSITLVVLVLLFVKNVFVSHFDTWGYVFTLGVAYFFSRKAIKKAIPAVRAWWREKREEYMSWRMTRTQGAGAFGLALLLLIPPIPSNVASDLVLEPGRDAHVRAEAPGAVRQIFVKQGGQVKSGQVIATLENPDLEATARGLAQQLAIADSNVRQAQASSNDDKTAQALREQTRLRVEQSIAQKQVDALQIRVPFDGVVATPDVEQKIGQYLAAGDDLCEIVDRSTMKARILVRDWELEDVHAGGRAEVKVSAFAYRTYEGRVERILPAAALDRPVAKPNEPEKMGQELTNYFAVVMDFPNPDGSLSEGMTGTAKIAGVSRPVAWQAGRGAWRWMRSQIW
jgi:putative peptide zinc metalloprotease protein